jgi:hypothetical protein
MMTCLCIVEAQKRIVIATMVNESWERMQDESQGIIARADHCETVDEELEDISQSISNEAS